MCFSLTNQSPQNPRAGNPMRVPHMHYRSCKVFPADSNSPLSTLRESELKDKHPNINLNCCELIKQNYHPTHSRLKLGKRGGIVSIHGDRGLDGRSSKRKHGQQTLSDASQIG